MFGASIAAPLAIPPTVKPSPAHDRLLAVGVGGADRLRGRRRRRRRRRCGRPRASAMPAVIASIGSAVADQPGGADEHLVGRAAELGGDRARTSPGRRPGPAAPVAALAHPLLRTTAAARPPVRVRWALVVTTGAAVILFWVNTAAAATGWPSAVATRLRSRSPDGLMPHATPLAREPRRRRDAHGYTPDDGEAGGLGEVEQEVGALHGGARRALGEVVDGGDGHDPAGALVVAGRDVGAVRAERGLGGRRARRVTTTNGSSA